MWTPEMAKVVLENRNNQNRRISKVFAKTLALLMENGEFFLTNQGIAVGEDRELVDGQTRLQAIVNSGCSQIFLTALSIPREAYTAIDQGRRKHLGDALKHFLGKPQKRKIRGIVSNFIDQIDGLRASSISLKHRVNTYMYFQKSFDWVMGELYEKNPKTPKLANSAYLAAFARAHASGGDPEKLKTFYSEFLNNCGIVTESKLVSRMRDQRLSQNTAPSTFPDRKEAMNEMEYVLGSYLKKPESLKDRHFLMSTSREEPTFQVTLPDEITNGEFDPQEHQNLT
jgi:hypothetical protein